MGRLLFSMVSDHFFVSYILFDMSDTNKKKKYMPRYFVIAHQSLAIKVLKHTMHSSSPWQNSNKNRQWPLEAMTYVGILFNNAKYQPNYLRNLVIKNIILLSDKLNYKPAQKQCLTHVTNITKVQRFYLYIIIYV